MNKLSAHARRISGFSLVELMVAMVLGLIVIGAVLTFTMSSLRANTQMISMARLNQEMRNSSDFINRELRRAGYDEGAIRYYSQKPPSPLPAGWLPSSSPFSPLLVQGADDGCVLYAYDRVVGAGTGTPGVVDLARGEIRGIRRVPRTVNGRSVGVIEVTESAAGYTPTCGGDGPNYGAYPPTCSGSQWCALSDPRSVDMTQFRITASDFTILGSAATLPVTVRNLGVVLRGALIREPEVQRQVDTRIRVRAACLRASAICNSAPVGT